MPVMTVGGIDPSSAKIVIVETLKGKEKKPFIHSTLLKHDHPEDNCAEAFDFIVEFAMGVRDRDGQSPRLFVEAPVQGGSQQKGYRPGPTIAQSFVTGSILAAASQTECQITLVNNTSWKKKVLSNGNIAKENIVPYMIENSVWPELFEKAPIIHAKQHQGKIPNDSPDQDVIDAGCINLYGWKTVRLFERLLERRSA